jgi:UPF0716 family protein affecting phage T7 exclusion
VMRGRRGEQIRITPVQRASVVVAGLILMVPGFMALIQGGLHYQDYRGLLVFAPYSLLVGLAMIVFAIGVAKHK